jgi:hypothetical protein
MEKPIYSQSPLLSGKLSFKADIAYLKSELALE